METALRAEADPESQPLIAADERGRSELRMCAVGERLM
jgi:hypothetical protein